jgi:Ca2+/Na+ antiporter
MKVFLSNLIIPYLIGTSLPEVVSSIIITRNGKGGMAISNSIGSNVFDILMCLGLPWFIENVIIKSFQPIQVYSKGIFYSAGILFSSICVLIVCFLLNKWKLDRKFGLIMMGLWSAVTVLSCLFEYDVFGKFSMPNCE